MTRYYLGIDTGGTNTDAVLFDPVSHSVVVTAKADTTHHDLALGVSEALRRLRELSFEGGLEAIERIHLSTTLATNAIAENRGGRVGLILMGYDADQKEVRNLCSSLPSVDSVFVAGSHDFYGQQTEALDEQAIAAAVRRLDKQVASWAVSGFFSVKNPAHEFRAAEIIKSLSPKAVTMGRDLTGELNAIKRAVTAALNASLVVIIGRLLDAVKKAAAENGLAGASLMVVKGDGTLVSEQWAREKPIETVVSGPAAGLVGARMLSRGFLSPQERNLWVLDVGGTTSDLALVKDGLPDVNPNGARVGRWDTMTMAVETRTRGLGGDSMVAIDNQGLITLGPRRVMPLCRLAGRWPETLETLRRQKKNNTPSRVAGSFLLPGAPPGPGLSFDEKSILEALARQTPFSVEQYAAEAFEGKHHFIGLWALNHPSILVSAFTPTDAMSILGLYNEGSRAAAEIGAHLLGRYLELSAEEVARRVLDEFGRLMAQEIVALGLERGGIQAEEADFAAKGILGGPLKRRNQDYIELGLKAPDTIILLGAPVAVLSPFLGQYLSARILVPPVFDVASAVGAAASPVHLTRRVEIHALPHFAGYRLFLPNKVVSGYSVNSLATEAISFMDGYMKSLAAVAGAKQYRIDVERENHHADLNDGSHLDLGATLTFTLVDLDNNAARR